MEKGFVHLYKILAILMLVCIAVGIHRISKNLDKGQQGPPDTPAFDLTPRQQDLAEDWLNILDSPDGQNNYINSKNYAEDFTSIRPGFGGITKKRIDLKNSITALKDKYNIFDITKNEVTANKNAIYIWFALKTRLKPSKDTNDIIWYDCVGILMHGSPIKYEIVYMGPTDPNEEPKPPSRRGITDEQ